MTERSLPCMSGKCLSSQISQCSRKLSTRGRSLYWMTISVSVCTHNRRKSLMICSVLKLLMLESTSFQSPFNSWRKTPTLSSSCRRDPSSLKTRFSATIVEQRENWLNFPKKSLSLERLIKRKHSKCTALVQLRTRLSSFSSWRRQTHTTSECSRTQASELAHSLAISDSAKSNR